jgi:hypothetical protein
MDFLAKNILIFPLKLTYYAKFQLKFIWILFGMSSRNYRNYQKWTLFLNFFKLQNLVKPDAAVVAAKIGTPKPKVKIDATTPTPATVDDAIMAVFLSVSCRQFHQR